MNIQRTHSPCSLTRSYALFTLCQRATPVEDNETARLPQRSVDIPSTSVDNGAIHMVSNVTIVGIIHRRCVEAPARPPCRMSVGHRRITAQFPRLQMWQMAQTIRRRTFEASARKPRKCGRRALPITVQFVRVQTSRKPNDMVSNVTIVDPFTAQTGLSASADNGIIHATSNVAIAQTIRLRMYSRTRSSITQIRASACADNSTIGAARMSRRCRPYNAEYIQESAH